MPVHIGVCDLKNVAFLTLHPLFLKWSKNAAVDLDQLRLRNKDWVEMIPRPGVQDIDAIAAKFFIAKGKARNVLFHAGKGVEVFLKLQQETYLEILFCLENDESEVEQQPEPLVCPNTLNFLSSSSEIVHIPGFPYSNWSSKHWNIGSA